MRCLPAIAALVVLAIPALGCLPVRADVSLWTGSRGAEDRSRILVEALHAAADHGLETGWYGVAEIEQALESDADRARTERLLTAAFVAYAGDLSTGRVRANRIDANIDIRQRSAEPADLLVAAAAAADFRSYLATLAPRGDYAALQRLLASLRRQREVAPAYTPLPAGVALRPGATDARVPVLRTRLAELGFAVPAVAQDAAELYDPALVGAVKAYQAARGLSVDGVIGSKTARSLNTTLDERIDQVIANLERRRWLPADLGRRHVMVNAGNYSMEFVDNGRRVFTSAVIVGTSKDQTPEIQSTMHGFQINPYWTVPQSIAGEEYLPLLRRDPQALTAGGFRIFTSWSEDIELDPATVDWSKVHPKAFPFRIRQDPGPSNALGYIFFPFANKYGVYMHDTANRILFDEGSRNFSHGCIRLRNPLDFVERAFGGRKGFDRAGLQAAIADGDRVHYTFPEPIVLHVTYRTVTIDDTGAEVFRDDVYGRDGRVVREMARPRS